MEVVNTLDIDGTQWEIRDEEARNKIAELETKPIVKVKNKINNQNVKMNLVEIDNEQFIHLHIQGLHWSGEISEIVVNFINDFGMQDIVRCLMGIDFDDGSGRDTVGIDIAYDGTIRLYPHTPNKMNGMYKAAKIYGDAFIRITY